MKQDDLSANDLQCLKMGRAVMLTGLRLATDILAEQIAIVEGQLQAAANGHDNGQIKASMQRTMAKIGHPLPELPAPKKNSRKGTGGKNYWAKMTPEERKAEMSRRYQMRGKKKSRKRLVQPNHPRNASHPKHEEWLATVRKANRESWAKMSPAKRKARSAAALAGRLAKKIPTVKMKQS